MARNSFKRTLNTRIKQERTRRGISGADLLEQRRESMAPNPRHMVAFSSDDLPALRSGRRPPHTGPANPNAPNAPAAQPAPAAPAAVPPAAAPPAAQAAPVPAAPAKTESSETKPGS